jgi:hypothetical protein
VDQVDAALERHPPAMDPETAFRGVRGDRLDPRQRAPAPGDEDRLTGALRLAQDGDALRLELGDDDRSSWPKL